MQYPVVLGLVSYQVFPARMGGQKHIAGFYAELSKHTGTLMAAARQNAHTGDTSFPVFPFLYDHWKGILNIIYLYRLCRLVKQYKADVILVEHSYFGFLGILLRMFCGKPYAIRSQNIEAHRFRDMGRGWWRIYERYERRVHRKADMNFFITAEDRDWAVQHWKLDAGKCMVSTYGSGVQGIITLEQRLHARQQLLNTWRLPQQTRLFLFNGTLDYLPNTEALRVIVHELLPLLQQKDLLFRIIICGKGLDARWQEVLQTQPEIIYAGFVPDIRLYFMGADCLINPITLGGGIRTKMIEALAHQQTVVSVAGSAHGLSAGAAGNKLIVVADNDWPAFSNAMAQPDLHTESRVPETFQADHDWRNIVQKALLSLQTL